MVARGGLHVSASWGLVPGDVTSLPEHASAKARSRESLESVRIVHSLSRPGESRPAEDRSTTRARTTSVCRVPTPRPPLRQGGTRLRQVRNEDRCRLECLDAGSLTEGESS